MILSLIKVCGFVMAAFLIWMGYNPIKESNGDKRYSAIFIRGLQDGMQSYNRGDLWFNQEYRDFVICFVLYDKNAVDYLKSVNPDIEVMF